MAIKKRTKKPRRKRNHIIYFLVEGNTEALYLNHLKNLINEKLIKELNRSGISFDIKVTQNIKNEVKNNTVYNEVYLVKDIEGNSIEDRRKINQYINTYTRFKDLGLTVIPILSNISFEVWLLQHHKEYYNKPVNDASQYLREINTRFNTNFETLKEFKKEKSFKNFLNKNIDLISINYAIENSNQLTNKSEIEPDEEFYLNTNPSTSFHKGLLSVLRKLGIDYKTFFK